nr:MAG TPA: hypothetical protein [Caudoviricetes sp.]
MLQRSYNTHQIPARKIFKIKPYLRTASRSSGVSQNCATVLDTPGTLTQNSQNSTPINFLANSLKWIWC